MHACPNCNSDRVDTRWTRPGEHNIRESAYECLDCQSMWGEPNWDDMAFEMNKYINRIEEEV